MINFTLADIQRLINSPDTYTPTRDPFVDGRYDAHIATFGHPRRYYRLFYRIAALLKPGLTVELGGWQGTGAAHLAAGCPAGMVVSIDHHSDPGDDDNQIEMYQAVGQYRNLNYFQGWTWDVAPQVAALGLPIDILFIDGWHHYDKAMRDWQTYEPLLGETALVICDDIMPDSGTTINGMLDFWADLPGAKLLDKTMAERIPMGFVKYVRQD